MGADKTEKDKVRSMQTKNAPDTMKRFFEQEENRANGE
jgi:hypothetical protein